MKRVAIVMVLAACGDDGGMATVDAPPDPCMPDMQFTGELVDWDSTATTFKGIFGAKFALESDPTKSTMTAPNGRFILCVPAADGLATVTPMTGTGTDYVGGTVKIDKTVIQSGAMLSYRSFTATRAADFGFDTAKASVFVHVDNGSRTVTTTDAPAVKKHFDGAAWVDGNTGTDIYLGGISGTMTSFNVTGGSATGASSIPIAPGQLTWITIVAK